MTEDDFQRLLYQHVLRACARERRRGWLRHLLRPALRLNPDPPPSPAPARPDPQRRDVLWQAVCTLPAEQRVALTLRSEFDLPVPTIARILRMGPGGVHARLAAARRSIAQTLGEAGGEQ
jgi:DNA-directed RNA polymerase specialized sigma24 family protein